MYCDRSFVKEDLLNWYPELKQRVRITLIEALPNVLPMFSKQLIDYTKQTFDENQIALKTKTMVSEVTDKKIYAKNENKEQIEFPYGLLVWATGNTARQVTKDLMAKIGKVQDSRRGLLVDEHLRVLGAEGIFALGDCTATNYAPTAQAASQQGMYLSKVFGQLAKKQALIEEHDEAKKAGADPARLDALANAVIRTSNIRPFHYSHQGSLAYIGSDKVGYKIKNGSVMGQCVADSNICGLIHRRSRTCPSVAGTSLRQGWQPTISGARRTSHSFTRSATGACQFSASIHDAEPRWLIDASVLLRAGCWSRATG
jgi:NADH dehydrogenase FAD-containing subunit